MNTIIGWLLKWTGVAKIWDKVDGYKTYGAAALGILTGLAGLAAELAPIISSHDTAGLIAFVQRLPTNPAWVTLLGAVGLLGLGHGIKKTVPPEAS